jgi:hypothetical protein
MAQQALCAADGSHGTNSGTLVAPVDTRSGNQHTVEFTPVGDVLIVKISREKNENSYRNRKRQKGLNLRRSFKENEW